MHKLWRINGHRIKKVTVEESEWHKGHIHTSKITKYKCIDCEKIEGHRVNFKQEECFEVIR